MPNVPQKLGSVRSDPPDCADRIDLLVVQPTPFCNLDCSYCYLPDRNNRQVMSEPTLRAIFRRVAESGLARERLSVAWHAGEPLVLPISFYERAFAICASEVPPDVSVIQHFQTNATLIDDAWAQFFRKHSIQLGVSLDGPEEVHDAYRKTRGGRGSFKRVMKGIDTLRKHGVEFSVISVLTADSLKDPNALIDFFVANDIRNVGFNIDEIEGANTSTTLGSPDGITKIETFFEIAWLRRQEINVRELEGAIKAILCGDEPVGSPLSTPLAMVTVSHIGHFMTFSPELLGHRNTRYGALALGSVSGVSLKDSLLTEGFRRMHADVHAGVEACRRTCEYFKLCGGGSPSNKLFEHGTFDAAETTYCSMSIKAPIRTALAALERSLISSKSGSHPC